MKEQPKQITFFTPSLNRSGSEIVLLNMLKALPDTLDFQLLCKYKGPLFEDALAICPGKYIYKSQFPGSWFGKLYRRLFGKLIFNRAMRNSESSLWYVNTILLPDVLHYAAKRKIPVILHVHELEHMYNLLKESDKNVLLNYPRLIIANSNASAAVLSDFKVRVPLKVIHPTLELKGFVFDHLNYEQTRRELGIGKEFMWIMSGTLDDNKNPGLFLELAERLSVFTKDFRMIWLAPHLPDGIFMTRIFERSKELNLDQRVLWLVGSEKYQQYFNASDGFVLTSKLESFSLVTLEALSLGLPIVANNCRGVLEILGNSYGQVVEGENAEQMCLAMWKVMQAGKVRHREEAADILSRFEQGKIHKQWTQSVLDQLKP